MGRRKAAERHPDHHREPDGREGEDQGVADDPADDAGHRSPGDDVDAKIARKNIAEEGPEPNVQRLVESHLADEALGVLGRRLRPEQRRGGIARHHRAEREQQQHRAEDDERGRDEPASEIAGRIS
jgi:hypothetical protein